MAINPYRTQDRKGPSVKQTPMRLLSAHLTSRESYLALRQGLPGRCYLDVISSQSGRYQTWPCSTRIRQAHSHGARFQVVLMCLLVPVGIANHRHGPARQDTHSQLTAALVR